MNAITAKECRAVRYMYDELRDFYEVVGEEASLDDDELPNGVLFDVLRTTHRFLVRVYGEDDMPQELVRDRTFGNEL